MAWDPSRSALATAILDRERVRLKVPTREEVETTNLAQESAGLANDRARFTNELDTEMLPLEREARRKKTLAEALYQEERGGIAREMISMRERVAAEHDEAMKEVQRLRNQGLQPSRELANRLKELNIAKAELFFTDPYYGKILPAPTIMQTAEGQVAIPADDPRLRRFRGGGVGVPPSRITPGAPITEGTSFSGTEATPAPEAEGVPAPGSPSPNQPRVPARRRGAGSAGAPQNAPVDPATQPGNPATTQPAALRTNPDGTISATRPLGQSLIMQKAARESAERMFSGMFQDLARMNMGNEEGPATLGRMGVAAVRRATYTDDDLVRIKDSIRGFVPLLARAVGHVGVLTELDVQRTEALFPQPGMSENLTKQKLRDLIAMFRGQKTMPFQYEEQAGRLTSPVVYSPGVSKWSEDDA